jgi:hypothetical protein
MSNYIEQAAETTEAGQAIQAHPRQVCEHKIALHVDASIGVVDTDPAEADAWAYEAGKEAWEFDLQTPEKLASHPALSAAFKRGFDSVEQLSRSQRDVSNYRDQEQPVAATESVFFAKLRDVSRGLDVIENALAVASGGDLSQVPFPLVGEDAQIHLNAQKGAYLHVLEMCSADSLAKWLAQAQSGMPDEAALLSMLQEVAQGLEVIEGALKISSSGDLSQAPFPLVGQEAQIHLNAQSEAYLHALEMCNASTIQEFLNGNLDQDRDAVTSYRDCDSCPGM